MGSKSWKWIAAVGAAWALSAPSVASAQLVELSPEDAVYGSLLTSSSTTVVSMIPLAFTVYGGGNTEWEWLLTSSSSSIQITSEIDSPSKRRRSNRRRRVLNYIQRNKAAVGQDVMLGGGEALADIASLLGVPEDDRADFAAAARDARAAMRPLLMDESAGLPELDVALAATVAAFLARRAEG